MPALNGARALVLLGGLLAGAAASGGGDEEPDWCDDWVKSNETVCDIGCFDTEDMACHSGLTKAQCAEIYGHVTWGSRCNCRTVSGDLINDAVAGPRSGQDDEVSRYFSVPAFVVLFRESMEVAVVLVIVIQFLYKAKQDGSISEELFKRLKREVYLGATLGLCGCLLVGCGFLALASMLRQVFRCDNLLIFDGLLMTLACVVLTFLALSFYKMIYTKEAHELKMRRQIEQTIEVATAGDAGNAGFGKKHAFFILAFTTGLREGMESIIFLVGVISDFKDPSYISSLPIPMILAVVLSRLVAWIFFQGTRGMRVDRFMRFCSVMLLFIAAGFFMQSMHKWQELGAFGTWKVQEPERPWQNRMVWDLSACCSDKTNKFFVFMRTFLGYQDQPTPIEFFAYILYWLVVPVLGYIVVKRAIAQINGKLEQMRQVDQVGVPSGKSANEVEVIEHVPVKEKAADADPAKE